MVSVRFNVVKGLKRQIKLSVLKEVDISLAWLVDNPSQGLFGQRPQYTYWLYAVYDNLLLSHEIDWNNEHVDCRRTTNGAWFAPSGDSTSLSTHQSTGNAAFTWLASSSAAGIGIVPRWYSGKYSLNDRFLSEVALEPMDNVLPNETLLVILSG